MIATLSPHKTEQSCSSQERLSKIEINDCWSAWISSSFQRQSACSSDTTCNTSYCPEGNSICKARRENGPHQTKQWTPLDYRPHVPLQVFKVEVSLLSLHYQWFRVCIIFFRLNGEALICLVSVFNSKLAHWNTKTKYKLNNQKCYWSILELKAALRWSCLHWYICLKFHISNDLSLIHENRNRNQWTLERTNQFFISESFLWRWHWCIPIFFLHIPWKDQKHPIGFPIFPTLFLPICGTA